MKSDADEIKSPVRPIPMPVPTPKVSDTRPRGYMAPTLEGLESVQENLREEVRGLVGHTNRLEDLFEQLLPALNESRDSSRALKKSCDELAKLVSGLSEDVLRLDARLDTHEKFIKDHAERLERLESVIYHAKRT